MNNSMVIIGAGGHGKVIADIAKKNGYSDIIFLDDNEAISECGGYLVKGTSKNAVQYKERDFFIAIGSAKIRQKIHDDIIKKKLHIVTLVHPDAVIGENVILGEGSVMMAGAVINPGTVIGKGCVVNTCASVDHDCLIGDYVHVSVGAHVAGNVSIGSRTWIGAGATVSNNVDIIGDCMIGAGAVVVRNIKEQGTYVGVPAIKK